MNQKHFLAKLTACSALAALLFSSCGKDPLPGGGTGGGTNPPLPERIIMDTSYGNHSKQKMDIYLPAGRGSRTRLIVMIHGGAWEGGDKSDMTPIATLMRLTWPDAAIVNINYRLASNSTGIHHTEIMNDISSAVQFMANNKTSFAISDTMAMTGASAGGHLAMLYTYAYNTGGKVRCVSNIFGPSIINDWSWYNSYNIILGRYVSEVLTIYTGTPWTAATAPVYESVSPYWRVNAASKPTIIFHGGLDLVVPVYQSQWMAARLNQLGVTNQYHEYPLDGHGFSPVNTVDCINKMSNFFKLHTQ